MRRLLKCPRAGSRRGVSAVWRRPLRARAGPWRGVSALPPDARPPATDSGAFRFEVLHQSRASGARRGRLHTPHGAVETPAYVPVGTNACVKHLDAAQLDAAGVQLMFCNTYHLLVHPGADVVQAAGGVHHFMNRDAPVITDSGGFQVFSLAAATDADGPELKRKRGARDGSGNGGHHGLLLKTDEQGTVFRSYIDGTKIELTPESSVQSQKQIGADIIIPLDELPPLGVSSARLAASVALSHRWMERSLREHLRDPRDQAMYGVVHGGTDRTLRTESVDFLTRLPFDGLAVGGALGRDRAEMLALCEWLIPLVNQRGGGDKPIHLLGIADPHSARAVVRTGVDTMDSCFPTRVARHGQLILSSGETLRIKQGRYKRDLGPIDPDAEADSLPGVSRAYLHHLFKQHEPLAPALATLHNVKAMCALMAKLRGQIERDEI